MKWALTSCFVLMLYALPAQDFFALQPIVDSVLSYGTYLNLVKDNHPLAINANSIVQVAENNLRRSRSGFDPQLSGNYRRKEYSNTEYYNALQAGIEIPTWMGLSFQAGYEENSGAFLNPESTVPANGLINAGISLQLGAGLLMDSRRAALRKGEIGLDQGLIDRQLLLNDLYYDASAAYFDWARANSNLQVAEGALQLATDRYEGVRTSHLFGDVPAIDTVEAYTQVLSRFDLLREAQSAWVSAINLAGVFLWDDEGALNTLPPGTRPAFPDASIEESYAQTIDFAHPELEKIRNKRAELVIDRRLAAEYLRPKVDLKYNFLTENISPVPADEYFQENAFFQNNFNFGAKVSYPLFLREARGKMGMAKVKIDMTDQELLLKQAALNAKLDALLVKLANLRAQVNFARQNVDFLNRLLDGERVLFENGESSLFLVNSRETKAIEAEIKLNNLLAKANILMAEIRSVQGYGF